MSGPTSVLPSFATSPNTCGVMGLLQSGSIFSSDLISDMQTLISEVQTFISVINSIPENILSNLSGFDQAGLVASLTTVSQTNCADFENHITTQLANLIQNLSIASSALSAHLGLMNSGCSLPTLAGSGATAQNPYPAMQVFFASILGAGEGLISSMMSATGSGIQAVEALLTASQGQLQGIADSITAYVQTVFNIGAGMTNLATAETAAFASVGADMLNFASTTSIISLYNNPCAALVINAVASTALAGFLNG